MIWPISERPFFCCMDPFFVSLISGLNSYIQLTVHNSFEKNKVHLWMSANLALCLRIVCIFHLFLEPYVNIFPQDSNLSSRIRKDKIIRDFDLQMKPYRI